MFTLGCTDLLVSTDHKPLLGIFKDRDLSSIKNPRIQDFKEATLAWRFSIMHNPGKWHKGPDAVSRQPSHLLFVTLLNQCTESTSNRTEEPVEERLLSAGISNLYNAANSAISLDDIRNEGQKNPLYVSLISKIQEGFPSSRSLTCPELHEFWEV